jgi:beta-galactosidase
VRQDCNDKDWSRDLDKITSDTTAHTVVYRADIEWPGFPGSAHVRVFYKSIGKDQWVYLNGRLLGRTDDSSPRSEFPLDASLFQNGKNVLAVVAHPFRRKYVWDNVNRDPGVVQVVIPPPQWRRSLFNGLAQVIVEATGAPGPITLTAESTGLQPGDVILRKDPH